MVVCLVRGLSCRAKELGKVSGCGGLEAQPCLAWQVGLAKGTSCILSPPKKTTGHTFLTFFSPFSLFPFTSAHLVTQNGRVHMDGCLCGLPEHGTADTAQPLPDLCDGDVSWAGTTEAGFSSVGRRHGRAGESVYLGSVKGRYRHT